MNVLEYFEHKKKELLKRLENIDNKTKSLISTAHNKKNESEKYIEEVANTSTISVDNGNRYPVIFSDTASLNILDRDNTLITSRAHVSKSSIESSHMISTDEVTELASCTISGDITLKDAPEVIDKSINTSISKTILTDQRYSYKTLNDATNTTISTAGLFFEICIVLPTLRKINYIDLFGKTKFYQDIVYIKTSETDKEYHRKDIPTLQMPIKLQGSISTSFKPVLCKRIYIGIVQSHYELAIKELDTKYSYTINISKCAAGYRVYSTKSAINSKYIQATSSSPVSIDATINKANNYELSEELYVSFDSVTYHNILPISEKEVYERLLFTSDFCKLRFVASSILWVKKDGELYKDYKVKKANGLISAISINTAPGSIYTILYLPTNDAYTVGISDKGFTVENEIIAASDSRNYTLSKTPTSISDVEVEILDNIKSKIYRGDKIANTSNNQAYWGNSKFAYSIIGNRILFNKELDDRYSINIKYRVHNNGIILRAIFRKNTPGLSEIKSSISDIYLITGGTINV